MLSLIFVFVLGLPALGLIGVLVYVEVKVKKEIEEKERALVEKAIKVKRVLEGEQARERIENMYN